jgi:hypothetical protein
MHFWIRPYRRVPLASILGFWLLLTLLSLSSGPAYADWVALGESDSGTTVYVDRDTRLPRKNW